MKYSVWNSSTHKARRNSWILASFFVYYHADNTEFISNTIAQHLQVVTKRILTDRLLAKGSFKNCTMGSDALSMWISSGGVHDTNQYLHRLGIYKNLDRIPQYRTQAGSCCIRTLPVPSLHIGDIEAPSFVASQKKVDIVKLCENTSQ